MRPRHRTTVLVVGSTDTCGEAAGAVAAADDLELFGAVTSDDLDATVDSGAPDIVVVSVGDAGLDAARRVAGRSAATRIVAVDADGADPDRLIDSGVGAVVGTGTSSTQLLDVVRGLAHGEGFLDAPLARRVLERHDDLGQHPLSPTEDEVLSRLAAGDTVDAIAVDYSVSPRLVRLHAGGPLARLLPR